MNITGKYKLIGRIVPAVLYALAPFVPQHSKAQSADQKRPNIIWISTEDLSPHFGCYGDKVAHTPNIDKLASQGIRFTNVFTTAAICAPCRAGIITGMYATSIGCMHMRTSSYRSSVDNPIEFSAVPPIL